MTTTETEAPPEVGARTGERLAVEKNLPGAQTQNAREAVQQRAFARAVQPEHGHDAARREVLAHLMQRTLAAIDFRDARQFDFHPRE